MDTRNILSLAGVLLVLGGFGYYWGISGQQADVAPDTERRPDYVATGITGIETDEKGRLLRHMQARELRHYDRPRDEAQLDAPVFRLYDKGREAWRVTAEHGTSHDENTVVRFGGGVRAERRDPDAVPLTFNTTELYVYPREERLATRADVQIDSPRGRLASRGLKADMKAGELELSARVTGNYAPATR
ncbi:MAG: lptC [Moraxellaceae bacterium]|jgi:LPS export ABC transporter protein LptC|nr:lptC [Moraxellaceae bacterium]MDF3030409.1 lptC [Moraxellaceae bacterium]